MRRALPLLVALACPLRAAFEEKPLTARAAALGESGAGNPFAPDWTLNPAALRFVERREAWSTGTRAFNMAELPHGAAGAAWPRQRGAWGFSAAQFGAGPYVEREASAVHAVRVAPGIAAGGALSWSALQADRYGAAAVWSVDAGLLGRPHPRAGLGFSVRRLGRARLSEGTELPSLTRAGAAFRWGVATASFDLVKPRGGPFSSRAGLEAALAPGLTLRVGAETRPARGAAGLGVRAGAVRVDYGFLSHPFLGDQHVVTLAAGWGARVPAP